MSEIKFQKLEDSNQRRDILENLNRLGEGVELQYSNSQNVSPKVTDYKEGYIYISGTDLRADEKVVFRFLFEKNVYFLMSSMKVNSEGLGLIAVESVDLFMLHRRENFRVPIPPERGTVVRLSSNVKMRILNISMGGALLASESVDNLGAYRVRDKDSAAVEDPESGSFQVDLKICHIKRLEDGSQLWGVEFLSIADGGISKINQFIMSSYRKSVSKYS